MYVTVYANGKVQAGALLHAVIPYVIVGGIELPFDQYDKTVTSNSDGQAYFPNPGLLALGGNLQLTVKATVDGKNYEYYAVIPVNGLGCLPNNWDALLSKDTKATLDAGLEAITANAKWIVIGILGIVIALEVRAFTKPHIARY